MEIKYRLKKEARQFFNKKLHKEIKTLANWNKEAVTTPLLEEVEMVYINYGTFPEKLYETRGFSASLCVHKGNEKESHFEFHFIVNDIDWKRYDLLNNDSFITKWMDEIQKVSNNLIKSQLH